MPDAPLPNCLTPAAIDVLPMGVHSGLAVTMLPQTQAAFAVNMTMRGGHVGTRPPIRKLAVSYATTDVQANLRAKYQGGWFYRSIGENPSCLITSVGGRLFRWTVQNNAVAVDEITPFQSDGITYDVNDPTRPQVWMAQGQDFLVVQDGQSRPYFFDGSKTIRSSGYDGQQLPQGRQVTYNNGRFVQVLTDGISYIASDLVYNPLSGTSTYNYRDSILRIKDNAQILDGRAFAVPIDSGAITAIYSVANPDSSLGQGPLQIGTENGIYSALLPLDATLWTTTQQPSQVVALPDNPGPTGGYATARINGDAWYRAPDGLRSFVIARRDFNTWVQTSLSFEMDRILPFDQLNLLPFASMVQFNNRLLCTCSPYQSSGRGVAHRGLVALDFNNISSLTTRSQPAYDGLWNGLPILQIIKGTFNGVIRCFLFALDGSNGICLYELGYDDANFFDFDGTTNIATQSYFESNALYGRVDEPDSRTQILKKLISGDIFLQSLFGPGDGTISFNVKYRSDQYPFWVDWHSFTLCAKSCYEPVGCSQPLPTQLQYAAFKRLPEPSDAECNPITKKPHRFGYYFQIRFAWAGHAELKRFNSWVTPTPATRNVICDAGPCTVLAGCVDNPFLYQIETGPGTSGLLEWDVLSNQPVIDVLTGSTITVI